MKFIKFRGKNRYLFSILFLFLISFTSAATDTKEVDDVFQINKVIQYTKTCVFNGTHCSSSAVCNYTFYDLDNSILLNNVLAANIGDAGASLWVKNITYSSVGVYQIDMVCSDQGWDGYQTFYAQVTGSGFNESLGFFILIFSFSFGVIILGFYLNSPPITILGSFGLYFVGVYILFNGLVGVKDMVTTYAIGIITLSLAGFISIKSSYELITG